MSKKLTRNPDKMLGGVCAGIADFFELDPTVIRLVYILVSFFSAAFPGLLIYVILWGLIPEKEMI